MLYSVTVDEPLLRIGELSRRLGVSDHVLRAWERRYGLLRPVRTAGGFRLYSEADLDRIRRMQVHLAQGLSAAEAARAAIDEEAQTRAATAPEVHEPAAGLIGRAGLAEATDALAQALDDFDEPAAQAMLDRLFSTLTVETVLRDVVMPLLRRVGERWAKGSGSVAQEHFASHVIRGRLASLGRGWGHGHGPRAVLACVPGELHDIGLLAFGVVLNRNGWRIDYLGPDTPLDDVLRVVEATHPDLAVLAASTPEAFTDLGDGLQRLARVVPVAIAGAGATSAIAEPAGAHLLIGDPVTAAEELLPPVAGPGRP